MCTATWRSAAGGYVLCFNRDEARLRAAELPPRIFRRGGVEAAAPFDGAAGGTWIGVNEFGFAACLLNAYPEQAAGHAAAPRPGRVLSRGFLVLGLLDAPSVDAARRRVEEGDLRWFRPFRLLLCGAEEPPRLLTWDGRQLGERELEAAAGMVCSSGWCDARANAVRGELWRQRFGERPPEESDLLAFHAAHEHPRSSQGDAPPLASGDAETVCMHRPDAATVSFARVRVEPGTASLLYSAQAPCAGIAGEELVLPRRHAARPGPADARPGARRAPGADLAVS